MSKLLYASIGGVGVAAALTYKCYWQKNGWKWGATLLKRKTDAYIEKVGLHYGSVRLPSGEESWFLERPGSAKLPALVVVPGFTMRAEDCAEWVNHLKVPDDRRVLILELPGHGRNFSIDRGAGDVKFHPKDIANWFETIVLELSIDEMDIYSFSVGAGIVAAAYMNSYVRGHYPVRPRIRHAALLNPFLPETASEKCLRAAAAGDGFAWHKGEEYVNFLRNWLDVESHLPGFIVEAVERERAEYPWNYWKDLSKQMSSDHNPILGPRPTYWSKPEGDNREFDEEAARPKVIVVWGEQDKVTEFSKRQKLIDGLPFGVQLFAIPNCGHVGVVGHSTDTIVSVSAEQISAHFFGQNGQKKV